MSTIREQDFVQSVADAFQYISYYHPLDYIQALGRAYEREQSPAARDAIAQILTNSRMCAEGKRPLCQDTGIAVVFLKVGMDVRWETKLSLQQMVDEGVRRAYLDPDNKLRASVLLDPAGARKNRRTTRRPSSMSRSSPATASRSFAPPRAAGPRTSRSSLPSILRIPSSTGS
jgi:fumarate hydratase class I